MVIYYLLGHAAELLLKSFLYKRGDSIEDLRRKLGHDISKLLERAKGKGLPNCVRTNSMLCFSELYKDKKTEYRSGGATLPLLDDLLSEVRALQSYVFDQVATFGDWDNAPSEYLSDPDEPSGKSTE